MVRCRNCGHINDEDAAFCVKCGSNLNSHEGMASSTKILILAVIILVGVLGVVSGMMLTMNENQPANTTIYTNESPTQVVATENWHQVASFTGSNNDYRNFQIRGNKFKVEFSAFPLKNFNTNQMEVQIGNSKGLINTGSVSWTSMEELTTKSKTLEVNSASGTYSIRINTKDLDSWTVVIYDYY